jgi:hypothetical protein
LADRCGDARRYRRSYVAAEGAPRRNFDEIEKLGDKTRGVGAVRVMGVTP